MRAGIFTTTIEDSRDLGIQETRHFRVAFEPGTTFDFDAGQFINILVPETPEHKAVKRPYSIASPPGWKGFLDLCWKRIEGGIATNYLWTLKKGGNLTIQGPLGRFTVKKPLPKTIIFISTGTGIAPFRSMIHTLLAPHPSPLPSAEHRTDPSFGGQGEGRGEGVEIWNIFGNRYVEDILYREEFEKLAKEHKNFRNIFTVSRPKPGQWNGETQYVQFMLKKYIPDARDKHIYICGLTNMITEVQKTALEMGFAKDQIFFEKYD